MNKPKLQTDPLDVRLAEWKVSAVLPPRFEEQVWKRIEAVERRESFFPRCASWAEAFFRRPAFAMSYVVLLLLIGTASGFLEARRETARVEQSLAYRYLHSVDPYQKTQ